jgi:hypothetical protein
MKIYTSRFSNRKLKDTEGIKTRISMGKPKWNVGYELEACKVLMPFGIPWNDNFEKEYRLHLEAIGVQAIKNELNRLSEKNGNKDIILLCYEDVNKGKSCHRRMFANWWFERTGEEIEELEKPQKTVLQLSIF